MTVVIDHLAGIVLSSPDPERLAQFYREALGLPFEERQHGKIREHLECEIGHTHFAILKKVQAHGNGTIVPSFAVTNLQEFLEHLRAKEIEPLHPVIDLGEGKRISTICDPDGNAIRLIQVD